MIIVAIVVVLAQVINKDASFLQIERRQEC